MKVICLVLLISASALAAPGIVDNQVESDSTVDKMIKYFGSCVDGNTDMTTCMAIKGITALNRASRAQNLELVSGISFARDSAVSARSGKALSENEILSSLPENEEEKSGRLYNMFLESIDNFFGSHNLVVKLPSDTTSEIAEGARKFTKKFKKSPKMMMLAFKLLALFPIFVFGLGFLSVKAFIVAKIALFLALALSGFSFGGIGGGSPLSFLGLGKGAGGLGAGLGLLGSGAASSATGAGYAGGSASNGWASTGAAGSTYPYARSYDEAQDVAYSAHAPATQ